MTVPCGGLSQTAVLGWSLSFDVWPPPIQQIVTHWYTYANRDVKRKFVRILLPRSRIAKLNSSVGLSEKESIFVCLRKFMKLFPVFGPGNPPGDKLRANSPFQAGLLKGRMGPG